MDVAAPSIEKIKASMRAVWMAGDFGVIARMMESTAEDFVSRIPEVVGLRVLDVATGSGNLAIPLARRGAMVTGVDIAANLLEQGRVRAAAEGLAVVFEEGDAEQLPFPDASFDVAVTMFGAMFAPRPELVAKELARVLKPGGRLAMANWNAEGFSGKMFAVGSKHAPGAAGIVPPVLWGDAAVVRERLQNGFTGIETAMIPIDFDLPLPPLDTVNFFRRYFGPTQAAYNRVGAAGEGAFTADLLALWGDANVAVDPARQTLVRNEYLQVRAVRSA